MDRSPRDVAKIHLKHVAFKTIKTASKSVYTHTYRRASVVKIPGLNEAKGDT